MAASGVRVTFIGLKELLAKLKSSANLDLAGVINKATAIVEAQAKNLVPVDSGELRSSIHPNPAKTIGGKMVGSVSTDKEYAAFVEFGTGGRGKGSYPYKPTDGAPTYGSVAGQVAQPYLFPAAELSKPKIEALVKEEVRKALLGK